MTIQISVIIPAYNAEKYIEKSVISMVNQTEAVKEIIIIDDGSNDHTIEIVERLKEQHNVIKLFTQANAGASAARNKGIYKAEGEWILFLDADDECDPTLLQQYIKMISENSYAAIYSDFIQINENSNKISESFLGHELLAQEGFCQMLLRNPIISPSGSIVRKSIFDEIECFDPTLSYAEDVDLWLRLLLTGASIGHVPQTLTFIRRHTNNTTADIELTKNGEKKLLEKYDLAIIKKNIYARNYTIEDNHLDYINFLIRYEKWKEAKQLLDTVKFEITNSKYQSFLFTKALVALHCEEFSIAQDLYSQMIKKNETHGAALNNMGVLFAMNGQLKEARNVLQQASQYYPEYLDAKHNIEQLDAANPIYRFTKRELRKNLLRYS